jgi:hypothetical protein
MAGRGCYHCKQWVEAGDPHDCWTAGGDEVEAPITDWLHQAYQFADVSPCRSAPRRAAPRTKAMKKEKTRTKQKAAKRR